MKKRRVLIVTPWYPSSSSKYLGIFVKDQAKALSEDNEVIVIHAAMNLEKNLISWDDEDNILTIHLLFKENPFHLTLMTFVIKMFFLIRKLIKSGKRPDIIHAHVYSSGFVSVLLGKIFDIPVVITEHSNNFYFDRLTKNDKKIARFAFNNADCVITVSKCLWSVLSKMGIENKHCVIPNVIKASSFSQLAPGKIDIQKKRIVSIGRLVKDKGHEYLIESARILRDMRNDFEIVIIGGGDEKNKLTEMILKNDLTDYVRLLGQVSNEEKIKILQQSAFYVHPSLYENFGVVLIEAMAAGKPVVSTDCGAPREIINETNGILVPTKNPEKLAEGINFMLDNYQKYSKEEIQNYVLNNYDYAAFIKKLTALYDEVLGMNQQG
jgi:glycosyltransferase involved in cell wall biosynthesis